MPDQNKDSVALFIDWDNLAISIAADLGGATPDVRRIVQTAQQFGVLLIARAYAEWTSTSERLGVYRAGVETVYAPTFRYETDPMTQTPRGKSLADPCMVADCVDILHLLPSIATFVIVSGDKDLIPVVRLAQLRGKRVVVIGPDYAAGVLREIADEFISYRKVIEADEGRAAVSEADLNHAVKRRPSARISVAQPTELAGVNSSRASRGLRSASSPSRHRDQDGRRPTTPVEVPGIVALPHEAPAAEPAIKADAQLEMAENKLPDLQGVFTAVLEILRQRTSDGKPRTRATNLKDALMVRLPGFSERRYGFSKFKDFLTALEKTGSITVSSAGPVHWVSLPNAVTAQLEQPVTQTIEQPVDGVRTQESPEVQGLDAHQSELVSFLVDLRNRSRWLTYTYVLTNLITHLGKIRPGVNAEAAARTALNQLVQNGVLRVDREPQEVEVGGIRHRVRMCHLEETHQLVSQIMAAGEAEATRAEQERAAVGQDAVCATQTASQTKAQPEDAEWATEKVEMAAEILASDEATADDRSIRVGPSAYQSVEPEQIGERQVEGQPAQVEDRRADEVPAVLQAPGVITQPSPVLGEYTMPKTLSPGELREDAWPEAAGIVNDLQQALLESRNLSEIGTERPKDEQVVEDRLEVETLSTSASGVLTGSGISLPGALSALRQVVLESTTPTKPRVGIAGLKSKLNGVLGHFDEQEFGFSKFKDFVAAAEKAGYVRMERVGSATWISAESVPEVQTTQLTQDKEGESSQPGEVRTENGSGMASGNKRRRSGRKRSPAESAVQC